MASLLHPELAIQAPVGLPILFTYLRLLAAENGVLEFRKLINRGGGISALKNFAEKISPLRKVAKLWWNTILCHSCRDCVFFGDFGGGEIDSGEIFTAAKLSPGEIPPLPVSARIYLGAFGKRGKC